MNGTEGEVAQPGVDLPSAALIELSLRTTLRTPVLGFLRPKGTRRGDASSLN
jgi:hypothetical protein